MFMYFILGRTFYTVSYTHLDVYKRQGLKSLLSGAGNLGACLSPFSGSKCGSESGTGGGNVVTNTGQQKILGSSGMQWTLGCQGHRTPGHLKEEISFQLLH